MALFDEAQGEEEWSWVDDIYQGAGLTAQHQLISIGEASDSTLAESFTGIRRSN
jgi:hypothetical protein